MSIVLEICYNVTQTTIIYANSPWNPQSPISEIPAADMQAITSVVSEQFQALTQAMKTGDIKNVLAFHALDCMSDAVRQTSDVLDPKV